MGRGLKTFEGCGRYFLSSGYAFGLGREGGEKIRSAISMYLALTDIYQ